MLGILLGSIVGKYASYILGAMGIALLLMILEPMQLLLKRRSVLQDVKRLKRLEQRKNQKKHV